MKNNQDSHVETPAAFFARIHGVVQGVGFRYSAVREAQRLKLTGWVRNAAYGDVEVWAEGPSEVLGFYFAWLKHGPQFAHVDSVDKVDQVPRGYRGFVVEY